MFSVAFGGNVLEMSVKSIWFNILCKADVSLFKKKIHMSMNIFRTTGQCYFYNFVYTYTFLFSELGLSCCAGFSLVEGNEDDAVVRVNRLLSLWSTGPRGRGFSSCGVCGSAAASPGL